MFVLPNVKSGWAQLGSFTSHFARLLQESGRDEAKGEATAKREAFSFGKRQWYEVQLSRPMG